MFKYVLVLLTCLCFACSSMKSNQKNQSHEIIKTLVVDEAGEIEVFELRIYRPESALSASAFMYMEHGKCTERHAGKYQENIDQLVWKKVLLANLIESLTVITDGAEKDGYFTSIVVYDINGLNCLSPLHPLKDLVENYFVEKLKDFNAKDGVYELLKNN